MQQYSPFPGTDNSNAISLAGPVPLNPSVLKFLVYVDSFFCSISLNISHTSGPKMAILLHVSNCVEFTRLGNEHSVETKAPKHADSPPPSLQIHAKLRVNLVGGLEGNSSEKF